MGSVPVKGGVPEAWQLWQLYDSLVTAYRWAARTWGRRGTSSRRRCRGPCWGWPRAPRTRGCRRTSRSSVPPSQHIVLKMLLCTKHFPRTNESAEMLCFSFLFVPAAQIHPQKIVSAPCVAAMLNAKQIRDLICPQKIASAPCVAAIL